MCAMGDVVVIAVLDGAAPAFHLERGDLREAL
jgi:hypothetical protein